MEKVLVKNAADEEQVKKASVKVELRREREMNDLASVLDTKHGRRFIWRFLGECGVFKSSFTGNSQTFFNEGQRNVGLKLLSEIDEAAPEAYMIMRKEAKEEFENV